MTDSKGFDIPANDWQNDKDDKEANQEIGGGFKAFGKDIDQSELAHLIHTNLLAIPYRTPDCMSRDEIRRYAANDGDVVKRFQDHIRACTKYCAKLIAAEHRFLAWKEMTGREY